VKFLQQDGDGIPLFYDCGTLRMPVKRGVSLVAMTWSLHGGQLMVEECAMMDVAYHSGFLMGVPLL
jgi:hypothetical protein